jgi:hypothetical protein
VERKSSVTAEVVCVSDELQKMVRMTLTTYECISAAQCRFSLTSIEQNSIVGNCADPSLVFCSLPVLLPSSLHCLPPSLPVPSLVSRTLVKS